MHILPIVYVIVELIWGFSLWKASSVRSASQRASVVCDTELDRKLSYMEVEHCPAFFTGQGSTEADNLIWREISDVLILPNFH